MGRKNFSVPSFQRVFSERSRELLPRRRTTTDALFNDMQQSPLHDLAPIALPGLSTRVTRNSSVGVSLDSLGDAFILGPAADTVVTVEGGYSGALLWASGVAVLSSLQFGFNLGNMNTAAEAMRLRLGIPLTNDDGSHSPENDNVWGLCVSIFCLGALLGCSVSASFSDRLGRRSVLLGTSLVYAAGALLEASSAIPSCAAPPCPLGTGVLLMLGGRVVTGVACGATTVVVPMYLGEISPPQLRGTLGTCFQLCCTVAMLFAQVLGLPSLMGNAALWPAYVLLVLLPAGLQLLLRRHLLESPRWLAGRSHEEAFRAQQVLAKLRGKKPDDVSVLKELDFMQLGQVNRESKQTAIPGYNEGVFAMLRDRSTRAGLLICGTCMVVQQFSGINNAFNFSTAFLSANGIEKHTITIIAILMNVGNVGVTLLSVKLMDKAGRRPLLLGSAAGMVAAIGLLTLALTADGAWTSPLAVVAVVVYVMAFGIGMGPVPWLLPAELFAMDKCAQGSGVAASSNWLANFVVVQAFPTLSNRLGGLCFLPFALVLVFFLWFVHARVPETRGKTLEQILGEISRDQPPQPQHADGRRGRRGLHSPYDSPKLEKAWPPF